MLKKSDGTPLETTLYENTNGGKEVTLEESSANYKKLTITVKLENMNWEQTLDVTSPNGKYVPIYFPSFFINSPTEFGINNVFALLYINGIKITKARKGTINKDNVATTNDLVLITKVVGYK